MIDLADARARGIPLPADDAVAQDIIDEQKAWLARRIGPLEGSRTETFYVGVSATRGKLALRRYTAAVAVTDGGATVPTGQYRLVDNGSAIHRVYASPSQWWAGPYVAVTYEPSDGLEVRHVLYELLRLETDEHANSPFDSETLGDYSYSRGGRPTATPQLRAALADSILPKRDSAATIFATSRPLHGYDPVINRPEVDPWP